MKIALDASHSQDRDPSGVAVYSRNLIGELVRGHAEERFLLCYRANRLLRSFGEPLAGENCSRRLLEEFACFLFAADVSVFHGLNQRLPRHRFRRSVSTFHDLFVMSGDYSTAGFRARFSELARDAAERSDHIIAVSEYTAGQIAGRLGVPRERISVVHHGVRPVSQCSGQELAGFREKHGLEGEFILHIGALQKRKNIERLVEAFEAIGGQRTLVLAGSDGFGAEKIIERITRSPARERIRRLGYVDRRMLERLYQTAAVLAFPSLDEGFGLPVLEAMSAGLPVVTSNRSALAEVAGEAALLADPEDADAIGSALERVLEESELRERLIAAGRTRSLAFGWDKAAQRTMEVYRQVR